MINNILVVGGTHGNELSGVSFVSDCLQQEALRSTIQVNDSHINIEYTLANQAAIDKRVRFVETDLNRQFSLASLRASQCDSLEHALAQQLDQQYGPKHQPTRDLVIDIHNTTSNMGANLIILERDEFHIGLARFVHHHMQDVNVTIEDFKPFKEHYYLCTLGKRGCMIEIGPQAHGVLRAQAYQQAMQMTHLIVQYCALFNNDSAPLLPAIQAYEFGEEIAFPLDENGNKAAMIHPELQDQDFCKLSTGMPVFINPLGQVTYWQGDDIYPHFIGEAAYYHLNVAFATATKVSL